ncbi:glycine N-acyltransferase-like protein 3 [Erythrolamprus reginae]|uniref:glycine N-acyltransferase-like protein 3 n=1 Tax=Erythrolamprus reginae TaxID=121349 RepID=UPI00396C8442
MLILSCSSKLQLLENVLRKGLPETVLVCGAVMHINRGNPAQHEVVVDSWPEFKAVLTRPRKEILKDKKDYYTNLHAAFYREEEACRTLLENKDAVDWDTAFQLQGLQDGIYDTMKVMAEARNVHMKSHFYQALLHPDADTFCQNELRSEPLFFGTLNSSYAAVLNDTYEFGRNNWSLRYLRRLIEDFPNVCLRDQYGQPVAWSLSDALGCLTHGYAIPEYRGKGHMRTVITALSQKLHDQDFALYTRVKPENKVSKQALSNLGFHILPFTKYILFFIPNDLE